MLRSLSLIGLLTLFCASGLAQNVPQFRGVDGRGVVKDGHNQLFGTIESI